MKNDQPSLKQNPRPAKDKRKNLQEKGLSARFVAAKALNRVLKARNTLEEALETAQQDWVKIARSPAPLSAPDFYLARAIATTSLRHWRSLNALAQSHLHEGGWPTCPLFCEVILTAMAQILWMNIPDFAAVNTAMNLLKSNPQSLHYAGLANAILRKITAEKAVFLQKHADSHSSEQNPLDTLEASTFSEIPPWLRERWQTFYGAKTLRKIGEFCLTPPHIDLTILRPDDMDLTRLEAQVLPSGSWRLRSETPIPAITGFNEGAFLVQDAASALPARLCGAKLGMRIADLCAAPGGKTAQLAITGAKIIAVERSNVRAQRLQENLDRLKLEVEVVIADVLEFNDAQGFDAVLLDAPCSASGTLRRHPEIGVLLTLEDVLNRAKLQEKLLTHAARLVKPGGVLVYATCSLEREEGEAQIERFLKQHPQFTLSPPNEAENGIPPQCWTKEGFLRVLPHHFAEYGGCDGFFAAKLQHNPLV